MQIIPVHPSRLELPTEDHDGSHDAAPRRTLGRNLPSRRTLGRRLPPSRRTLGRQLPSRRTLMPRTRM